MILILRKGSVMRMTVSSHSRSFSADDREANIEKVFRYATEYPDDAFVSCGYCFEYEPWCTDCFSHLYHTIIDEVPELEEDLYPMVTEWIHARQHEPEFIRLLDEGSQIPEDISDEDLENFEFADFGHDGNETVSEDFQTQL